MTSTLPSAAYHHHFPYNRRSDDPVEALSRSVDPTLQNQQQHQQHYQQQHHQQHYQQHQQHYQQHQHQQHYQQQYHHQQQYHPHTQQQHFYHPQPYYPSNMSSLQEQQPGMSSTSQATQLTDDCEVPSSNGSGTTITTDAAPVSEIVMPNSHSRSKRMEAARKLLEQNVVFNNANDDASLVPPPIPRSNSDRHMQQIQTHGEPTVQQHAIEVTKTYTNSHDSLDNEEADGEEHVDPFAPREGKTLTWSHVNMTMILKEGKQRKLLNEVWGEVPKKETTAIMGPSGAGKSSLLNILSGRASSKAGLSIEADVRLNNYTVDPRNIEVRKMIAFVAQDDSLQITATPREAIRFSAKLRLARATTDQELDELTERMLAELGLSSCADTIVGGPLLKGISGGERKRTSVGVELVVKPAMIFLDEPTSGLDSFSAVQVCEVLKKVANAGASVLFTIHQPSSEIFQSFDHLILLNKGRVMYQGAVKSVPEFFGARGHPCPPNYNPSDWIMNIAQATAVEDLERLGYFPTDERPTCAPSIPDNGRDAIGRAIRRRPVYLYDSLPPGSWTQILMLFAREVAHIRRDKSVIGARMVIAIFLSTLIGVIFFGVGETDSSISSNLQSHFGAIMVVFIFAMLGTAQPALLAFPDERPVFLREYSTSHYTVLSYFIARLTMEAIITGLQTTFMMAIPYKMISFQGSYTGLYGNLYLLAMTSTALAVFVGCAAGANTKLAMQTLPLIFMPQTLFAGFFVTPDLIPRSLRWLQYIMPLTYGVRVALIEELYDCSDDLPQRVACNTLLESVNADPDELTQYWFILGLMFVTARLVALWILQKNARKFY